MEFGPRALGHRSIIVDPRRKDAKDLLNEKIKRRESFRPFAPSILKEAVSDYFVQKDTVPFMEKVFDIKKEKYDEIPAVTHVDGTGRLQSVDIEVSPRYHKLISKFAEKSAVPILLNTSFNENEPIVNKPEEALSCFLRTKMDMLVMENIIIEDPEILSIISERFLEKTSLDFSFVGESNSQHSLKIDIDIEMLGTFVH